MIRRRPLSPALLQESDDALRTVVGLLDDVAPAMGGPAARALDLHLALGLLERIYELESASDADDVGRFRRALQAEYERFTDPSDARVP